MKDWPFKVINDGGRPKVQVEYKGETKTFFAEEISSMILTKMKETAEAYLGKTCRNVIISVPANFNDAQRQATMDAGTLAGLNVKSLVNEPTAAAIAFDLEKKVGAARNVLVYDLGGGTLDVSILSVEDGVFEVRSTSGETNLGGKDFDTNLVDYFIEELEIKGKKDIRDNKGAVRRLRTECEKAKRELGSKQQASIEIDALCEGIDFYTTITRARFWELNFQLFKKTIESVEIALTNFHVESRQILKAVLVGGSTKIPKIQSLFASCFIKKGLNVSMVPDEAVAYGAAVQAAILSGNYTDELKDVFWIDVLPRSLSMKESSSGRRPLINRYRTVPTKRAQIFTTKVDNQSVIFIQIYEDEETLEADSHLLCKVILRGIPPAPKGTTKFRFIFQVNENGILSVSAFDHCTGKEMRIKVDKGRLSEREIKKLVRD